MSKRPSTSDMITGICLALVALALGAFGACSGVVASSGVMSLSSPNADDRGYAIAPVVIGGGCALIAFLIAYGMAKTAIGFLRRKNDQ